MYIISNAKKNYEITKHQTREIGETTKNVE